MARKKKDKALRLKTIYDLKKSMRTFWGALTSLRTQIDTVNGTVDEIQSLLSEVSLDIREMNVDLNQIREEVKKNDGK